MTRETIIAEIAAERTRQDELWGGEAHDATHRPADWLVILCRHVGLAAYDGSPSDVCHKTEKTGGYDERRYRKQLVRVAAVAVAALEAFDRHAPPEDPLEFWRKLAARFGEPLLVLDRKFSVVDRAATPCLAYAVAEADASEWERQNHVARVEPSANGATP